MPKLTDETKQERETIVRWDETDELAYLWTASVPIRNEWKGLGYELKPTFREGWEARVPKDRVSFKPAKKSRKG